MSRRGAMYAGGLIGTAAPVAVALLAAPAAPVLYEPAWALLMGGVVIVCALAGAVLALCVRGLRDLALRMAAEHGPLPRRRADAP